MKRYGSANVKFPNSVQLFKFCQKVFMHQRGGKVRDQEVGSILSFNPSDCSHWKRGEKNVKSVFALAKLSEALRVESSLIHDVASGITDLDEAFFEYLESRQTKVIFDRVKTLPAERLLEVRTRVMGFVDQIHQKAEFSQPPLYLPEVMRCFPFVSTTPVEMLDRLSRILKVKPGKYCIQFKKGELKPQTRLSMVKDLARIVFEGERNRFPELGAASVDTIAYEELLFSLNLLIPAKIFAEEIKKNDSRRNIIAELASSFWVPKSFIGLQLQELLAAQPVPAPHFEVPSPSHDTPPSPSAL